MIQLAKVALPKPANSQLRDWQQTINELPTYAERVEEAAQKFSSRNRKGNATFSAVKICLDQMCCGERRCMYCEDSMADEIEHIFPKNLFPEVVFAWKNYLYACGTCNGPKRNRFKLLSKSGQVLDLTRAKGAARVKPPAGRALLINPRIENPLDFMDLDIMGTFLFVPRNDTEEIHQRAAHTIEVLRLNVRSPLQKARQDAFRTYRARLKEYSDQKKKGAPEGELKLYSDAIARMHHVTVWKEMQRKQAHIPELRELFNTVPEALTW